MRAEPEATKEGYHVLKEGKISGPFTRRDLESELRSGHLSPRDLVQVPDRPVWQPLEHLLAGSEGVKHRVAAPPDWRSILEWTGLRLRQEMDARPERIGLAALGLGVLAAALSAWPLVFWLPWLAIAAAAAIALVRQRRTAWGFLLLLGVAAVPVAYVGLSGPARPTPSLAQNDAAVPTPMVAAQPAPVIESPAPAVPVAQNELPAFDPPSSTPLPAPPAPQAEVAIVSTPEATPQPSATPVKIHRPVPSLLMVGPNSGVPGMVTTPSFPGVTPTLAGTAAAELMQSHKEAFVIVTGAEGSGSGFVCQAGGKTWLFTNIHVVADILQPMMTRLDNVAVTPGAAEVAPGPDIARFAIAQPPAHPLEVIDDFDTKVRIGDDVVVLGNSGGGGVVTNLEGKVVGIGPDRLEVTAEFIPGNSGSPIIHLKTGKVIGIATYLTRRPDEFGSGSPGGSRSATPTPPPNGSNPRPPFYIGPPTTPVPAKKGESTRVVVRRFGYRIDNVANWEPVNWPVFRKDAQLVHQVTELTDDIIDFLDALRLKQSPQFATDTLRRPANQWLSRIRARQVSESDRLNATQSFLSSLRFMVRGDIGAAETQLRYTYFKNELRDDQKAREMLYKAFDAESASLVSPTGRSGYR